MNIPETIEVTGAQLISAYGVIHVLYALGIHYKWVFAARGAIKKQNQHSTRENRICKRCMTNQLVPLMLWGLEFKAVQSLAFGLLWIAQASLGGGVSAPFKMRLHKDPSTSIHPRGRHGY